ncbi:MAG: amino acid ABC transporter substrate-binding protein [Candidatus Bipolaricaulia bacterium]
MRRIWVKASLLALVLVLVVALASSAQVMDRVKARGRLICGVNGGLPGFSFLSPDGSWNGFDADYCRAIAAAVLGDPSKVEFVPLTAAERFTALQTGEIDVLIRNTTWTLTRDSRVGADFAPTTFYDGQGFMVPKALGIKALEDLAGASICVTSGTTTELNLADTMRALGVPFTPVVFEEIDTVYNGYEQGRCDAVTSDKSQLAARRTVFSNPDAHEILAPTISKEPLGPLTIHGDNPWNDVVSWVVYATFFAEEHGITQANVNTFTTFNPEVQRFLGVSGDMGEKLGLSDDWARNIIAAVGNYAEIFTRNLTPIGLPRGVNQLWTQGGLLYAMPFR